MTPEQHDFALGQQRGQRLGDDDRPVELVLYATGIRNRASLAGVKVTINGTSVPVLYAGPQPDFAAVGLDQVNVALALSLRGAGESQVVLSVDGQVSNTATVNFKSEPCSVTESTGTPAPRSSP